MGMPRVEGEFKGFHQPKPKKITWEQQKQGENVLEDLSVVPHVLHMMTLMVPRVFQSYQVT